jgi:hypothetical protein
MADEQISPAKLTQKIQKICEELNIHVKWQPKTSPVVNHASKAARTIWVQEIDGLGDYAAALHEIGHVLNDPATKPASPLQCLQTETKAWKWAVENYSYESDDELWTRLYRSLSQYKDRVSDLSSDHPAHALLKEAERRVPSLNRNAAPNLRNMPL